MAYRPFNWVSNNASWGRTLHTKKGVLKRGYAENFGGGGCGTLKPPPDGVGGGNEVFVLYWDSLAGKWKWGKLYYTVAIVDDYCSENTSLVQSFSPMNISPNPCASNNWQFFGSYDAECDDEEPT
jgi:hypothetical protein